MNSTSLFSLDTKTEFMIKLWINQESVLKMIGTSQKAVGDILLRVHKLLEKKLVRSKHFTHNVGVSVCILWTEQ